MTRPRGQGDVVPAGGAGLVAQAPVVIEEGGVVDVAEVFGKGFEIRVIGAGLHEEHADARVFADARGDHCAAGAGADDDQVVVGSHRGGDYSGVVAQATRIWQERDTRGSTQLTLCTNVGGAMAPVSIASTTAVAPSLRLSVSAMRSAPSLSDWSASTRLMASRKRAGVACLLNRTPAPASTTAPHCPADPGHLVCRRVARRPREPPVPSQSRHV